MPYAVSPDASHAEDAERGGPRRRVERSCEGQAKHAPCIGGVDDAIVPQPRGCKLRRALAVVPVSVLRSKGLTARPATDCIGGPTTFSLSSLLRALTGTCGF